MAIDQIQQEILAPVTCYYSSTLLRKRRCAIHRRASVDPREKAVSDLQMILLQIAGQQNVTMVSLIVERPERTYSQRVINMPHYQLPETLLGRYAMQQRGSIYTHQCTTHTIYYLDPSASPERVQTRILPSALISSRDRPSKCRGKETLAAQIKILSHRARMLRKLRHLRMPSQVG